jgi:hypothetical protein
MRSTLATSLAAGTPSPEPVQDAVVRRKARGTVAERDALYLHNERMRLHPQACHSIDADTPVSVLGLEQTTISRLYRVGILRLEMLQRCSVEELWRSMGRHGISNILDRLEANGLSLMPLTEYEKWRLGRVAREEITLRVGLETPVAELWPRLGTAVTQLLRKRGMFCVADLVPTDEDRMLQLYRLGKANLRRIRAILLDVGRDLDGEAALRLRRALELMASHLDGRRAVPLPRR